MKNYSFLKNYYYNSLLKKLIIFGCAGLLCCLRAFSSSREQGLVFVVVRGLLIAVASLVVEHRL